MSTFTVVGAREYGTGAVVDYTSRKSKNGAAIVLAVAPDRNWGVNRFGVITKPSTHTSDEESRAGFDDTVDSYLKAVRTRDCGGYIEVAFTNGVRRKKDICTIIFAGTTGLAKRLKANPSAKPNYEGGNATYGFYTLETNKPSPASATISVIRDEEGAEQPYLVLDVTPSPTTAEQRKARRAAQQAKRNQGNLEPSSKPSDPAVTTP